jgi:hypothetical protein
VAGIVKEIVTILAAVLLMPGDGLTLLNVLGLAVSIAGIIYYNMIKMRWVLAKERSCDRGAGTANRGCTKTRPFY